MADLIARVNALIARTTSAAEEEARTSAVIACRLIREHGLQVVEPSARRPHEGPQDFWQREERSAAPAPPRAVDPERQKAFDEYEERLRAEREGG